MVTRKIIYNIVHFPEDVVLLFKLLILSADGIQTL